MPSQFDAQTMLLGQLFANAHTFQIPTYQRSFAWETREASLLLEEMFEAFDSRASDGEPEECFLGFMVFVDVEQPPKRLSALPFSRQSRRSGLLDVVDGLQRLTTLTMLFCIIRDLEAAEGGKPNERLLAAIGLGAGQARHRLTLREPEEAFFHAHVRVPGATRVEPLDVDLSPPERRILEVRDYLLETVRDLEAAERRRLVDFLLDRTHVLMVTAATLERAHRIFTVLNARGKPLARNDILKAELLGRVPPAAREHATGIWDKAESRLGDAFEALFSHVRTIEGRGAEKVITAIRAIAADTGGCQVFIERTLQPAAAIFDDINHARHEGSQHSPTISELLTYLGWLKGSTDWIPPAILWWLGQGKEPAELAWFLGGLDRLAYGLRILGHGTKRRATRFGAVVQAIRNQRDLRATGSPLDLTREELRTVHHNLRDLHTRSAPMAKLVLLRLNDHLAGNPQGVGYEDLSVEHLLPRKPGANSPWRLTFPDLAERDRCTESLGNLVLVTKAQNDKAGNAPFVHKRDILFKAGTPMLPVNAYVRQQTEWTSHQIKEREGQLLRHLDQLWKFSPAPVRGDVPPGVEASPQQRRRPPKDAAGG